MDRSRFGYGELVTADTTSPGTNDDKLNLAFDRVEASIHERQLDLHPYGIISGLSVVENSVPNMTVRVTAGVAQDQSGQRIEVPSTQSVSMETDYQSNAIALPSGGQQKYASVFVRFKRLNQNATQDQNSVAYNQDELESFEIRVRAGSSAPTGTATPPALQGAEILLADVLLTPGMTAVTTGDIKLLTRRQDAWNIVPTNTLPKQIRVGTAQAAVTQLLSWLNDLLDGDLTVSSLGVTHSNGAETFAGAIAPPTDGPLQTWLRALVTMLGKITATPGAALIGNITLGTWADSSNAGAAGGLSAQIIGLVTALAASTGTAKIGGALVTQSPTALSAGTLLAQLTALLTAINLRTRKGSAETITAAWDFTTAPTIAFTPSGSIAATDVHAAIAELDTDKAALAGATFTGEVRQPRPNLGTVDLGVIAANTQLTNAVGLVLCQCPATNSANFNIAFPAPAAGNPIICFKFRGGTGSGRRVWLTTTANVGSSPPTDYFAYWDASVDLSAGAVFAWDGSRWRHITSTGLTGLAGGGALAD